MEESLLYVPPFNTEKNIFTWSVIQSDNSVSNVDVLIGEVKSTHYELDKGLVVYYNTKNDRFTFTITIQLHTR